jgi:hypothetical protein
MDTLLASLELHWKALADLLVGLCLLAGTWAAFRTKRWLLELVERERAENERLQDEHAQRLERQRDNETRRANETLKRFTAALTPVELPSLDDWLANVERNWSMQPTSEDDKPAPSESGLRRRQQPSDDPWDAQGNEATKQLPDETTRPETPDARARRSDWPPS